MSTMEASAVSTTAPPLRMMVSASTIIGASISPTVTNAESAITPRVNSVTRAVASGSEVAGCDIRSVDRRTPACGHTAADQTGPVQRKVVVDLDKGALRHGAVLRERAEPGQRADVAAFGVPAVAAVELAARGHLGTEVTQVLVACRTPAASSARRQEHAHHVVADVQVPHTGSHLLDYAGALVTANDGKREGKVTRAHVVIGVAQSGGLERDEHLAVLRTVEVDLLDAPILVHVPQHRGVHLHTR